MINRKNTAVLIGILFLTVFLTCPTLLAAVTKTNAVKFSQKFADKIKSYIEDGTPIFEEVPTWSWTFSGKIYDNFSADQFFKDDLDIEIIIGDFTTANYFSDISELKGYLNDANATEKEKKMRGKLALVTGGIASKNKGSLQYNIIFSWDVDKPNGDTITNYKKMGSISMKWDAKSLSFNIKGGIGATDSYNGADDPPIPFEIPLMDEPDNTKPVKQGIASSLLCQVRFGNKIYSNRAMGFSGKRQVQLVLKGPEKEAFFIDSNAIKEIKTLSILEEPGKAVAVNDSASTIYGTPVEIPVIENDLSEVEGDVLFISNIIQPTNGSATIGEDGVSIEYTPKIGFIGQEIFSYTINDMLGRQGGNSADVIVYVNGEDANRFPIAVEDAVETVKDLAITIDCTANDFDQDKDQLSVIFVQQPEFGKTKIANNKVIYTPNTGYVSDTDYPDIFEYTVSDNKGGTATAFVDVYVGIKINNTPPDATDNEIYTSMNKDAFVNVVIDDTDAELDALSVVGLTDPSHGTVQSDGVNIDYTPNPGYYGMDSFIYTVSDGMGGTDTATVRVYINSPPVAYDDVTVIGPDSPVTIEVLMNDIDLDNDTLNVVSITPAKNGSSKLNGNKVEYMPFSGFKGSESFTYTIDDGNDGESTGYITIFVDMENNNIAPEAADDIVITEVDTGINIEVTPNDKDADNDPIRIISVSQPKNGTSETNEIIVSYTPNKGFTGHDSFTYVISDTRGGLATATVTITVNTEPIAIPDYAETTSNKPVTINPVANDYDADADILSVSSVSSPTNGTVTANLEQITYTPNIGFSGIDTFSYTVADGRGGSDIAFIEVTVYSQ